MKTTIDKTYRALLDEYRIALGLFTGTRALYPATSPEVAAATEHIKELEKTLASYDRSAVAA